MSQPIRGIVNHFAQSHPPPLGKRVTYSCEILGGSLLIQWLALAELTRTPTWQVQYCSDPQPGVALETNYPKRGHRREATFLCSSVIVGLIRVNTSSPINLTNSPCFLFICFSFCLSFFFSLLSISFCPDHVDTRLLPKSMRERRLRKGDRPSSAVEDAIRARPLPRVSKAGPLSRMRVGGAPC